MKQKVMGDDLMGMKQAGRISPKNSKVTLILTTKIEVTNGAFFVQCRNVQLITPMFRRDLKLSQ
jgi:hypothetical protein